MNCEFHPFELDAVEFANSKSHFATSSWLA